MSTQPPSADTSDDPVFQAGYRAALAHLAQTIAVDPLAVSAAEAYRAAVDVEAMQAHTAGDIPRRRLLERRLADADREGGRLTKQLKVLTRLSALRKAGRDQARQDLSASRGTRDDALAALARVVEVCDQYAGEKIPSIPIGEIRAAIEDLA